MGPLAAAEGGSRPLALLVDEPGDGAGQALALAQHDGHDEEPHRLPREAGNDHDEDQLMVSHHRALSEAMISVRRGSGNVQFCRHLLPPRASLI